MPFLVLKLSTPVKASSMTQPGIKVQNHKSKAHRPEQLSLYA